jgi:AcrR family transcriptional regulator
VAARRHGEALERALLDAAWDELVEGGYAAFTMDAVAARAGTSRPVLYRRWTDKHDLVRAAVAHAVDRDVIAVPDTGSLRDDTIALMKIANKTRAGLAAVVTVHLDGFYQETGSSPEDLRKMLAAGRPRVLDTILDRAAARGEIRRDQVSGRIASLPFALLLVEFVMTLKPVPASVIEEIVDTVFLPLVSAR